MKKKSLIRWLEGGRFRAPALLFVLTGILWGRTLGFDLHYWDDSVYLFQDPRINDLAPAHLWAILTKDFFANYHPVTTFTYLFDRTLWGQWVPGFHLTHLLFYAAGVSLVYEFFRRLLKDQFWAFMGAALFSAHALHVEAVAWLACRKDVVCLVFYAAALLAYERYAVRRDGATTAGARWPLRDYSMVLLWTALALGSKGYAAVLPLAFLARDLCFSPRLRGWLILDKLPLLGLAAGLVLLTFRAQDANSALIKDVGVLGGLTALGRTEVLMKILALYVGRSLLPLELNAKYLVSAHGWHSPWLAWLGLAVLAGIAIGFLHLRKRSPVVAYALALFALPLATTLNTFFTLRIWMADRYLLLPTLGSCLGLVWAGMILQKKFPQWQKSKRAETTASVCLAVYCVLTLVRTDVWSSLIVLRSDVVRKNAAFLAGHGPLSAAEFSLKAPGRKLPIALLDSIEELAVAYDRASNQKEARAFRELLRQTGRVGLDAASHLIDTGKPEDAIPLLLQEVKAGGWNAPVAARTLGDAYSRLNDAENARNWYHRAFDLFRNEGASGASALMGELALEFQLKNFPRVREIAVRLQQEAPADPRGVFFEGRALEDQGQPALAYEKYRLVERLPHSAFRDTQLSPADVQRQMGVTAQRLGDTAAMRKHYSECLRLDPNDPQREAIETIMGLRP